MPSDFYFVSPYLPAEPFSADYPLLAAQWQRLQTATRRYEVRLTALGNRQDLSRAARWRVTLEEIDALQRCLTETSNLLREAVLPPTEVEFRRGLEARAAVAIGYLALADYRRAARRAAEGGV